MARVQQRSPVRRLLAVATALLAVTVLVVSLLAALGAVVGSVLAVVVGQGMGPEPLVAQGAVPGGPGTAPDRGLTSPLALHAPGVALVWPATAGVVAALGHDPRRVVAEVPGDAANRRTWWCPACQPGPGPERRVRPGADAERPRRSTRSSRGRR